MGHRIPQWNRKLASVRLFASQPKGIDFSCRSLDAARWLREGVWRACVPRTFVSFLLQTLPSIVVAIHLAWILWVIAGAFWTRGRPWLTAFHVASLVWGIVVETCPVNCPLTLLEQALELRVGNSPWAGSFLLHTLDAIVYPNVSADLLIALGVAVCTLNLSVYAWRLYGFFSRPG